MKVTLTKFSIIIKQLIALNITKVNINTRFKTLIFSTKIYDILMTFKYSSECIMTKHSTASRRRDKTIMLIKKRKHQFG